VGRTLAALTGDKFDLTLVVLLPSVVILTPAVWVLFFFTFGSFIRRILPVQVVGCMHAIDRCTECFVRGVASRLFGLVEETANVDDEPIDAEELQEDL
jgi:hypothetical protein